MHTDFASPAVVIALSSVAGAGTPAWCQKIPGGEMIVELPADPTQAEREWEHGRQRRKGSEVVESRFEKRLPTRMALSRLKCLVARDLRRWRSGNKEGVLMGADGTCALLLKQRQ